MLLRGAHTLRPRQDALRHRGALSVLLLWVGIGIQERSHHSKVLIMIRVPIRMHHGLSVRASYQGRHSVVPMRWPALSVCLWLGLEMSQFRL